MKKPVLLLFILFVFACKEEKFTTQTAKDSVWRYYIENSPVNGGGGYRIKKIEIISYEMKNDSTCFVVAEIEGVYEYYVWNEKKQPSEVDQKNLYIIKKQNRLWKVTSVI